jgi:hypothetical protein
VLQEERVSCGCVSNVATTICLFIVCPQFVSTTIGGRLENWIIVKKGGTEGGELLCRNKRMRRLASPGLRKLMFCECNEGLAFHHSPLPKGWRRIALVRSFFGKGLW